MGASSFESKAKDEAFYFGIAELLVSDRREARERLLQRIAEVPEDLKARLLYAKSLYLDQYIEHSVRELLEIKRRRDTASIRALLQTFGAVVSQFEGTPRVADSGINESDKTVGEIDFDLSVLDEE